MQAKNSTIANFITRLVQNIFLIINICCIILLVLSVCSWYIMPTTAPLIANLGIAFPIILFINILFLFIWAAFLKWRFVIGNLIILVLFLQPIKTYIPINIRKQKIPEKAIKLLSYNVRGFNSLSGKDAINNPIFSYILEQKPDIICLQEFAVRRDQNDKGLISMNAIDSIFRAYPFHHVTNLEKAKTYVYGIACYSKYPIIYSHKLPLISKSNGATIYKLDIKGKELTLINTHLESNHITPSDKKLYHNFFINKGDISLGKIMSNMTKRLNYAHKIRERQILQIKQNIEQNKVGNLIVCGDFNDTPISYSYHMIKSLGLTDSFAKNGIGMGITYHENKFLFRIDYIFHSKNINSYEFKVGNKKYSDHYPITTYIAIK